MAEKVLRRSDDTFGHKMKWVAFVVVLVVSVGTFVATMLYRIHDAEQSKVRSGETALVNCRQIEDVKREIRSVLMRETGTTYGRFPARDCYRLPVVKAAGLKKPE